jgi:L-amino acid N-acyltransferase YncA
MQLRDATSEDWADIWPIFRRIVAAGDSYTYSEGLDSEAARSLWMESPPGRTVVAVDDERVVGTAKMGANRPGRGAHVATASFMVDPAHRQRGVGGALCRDAVEWARTSGFKSMQFNAVVETNVTPVRLWESLGFEILATVPEAFNHAELGLVGLHVMYRTL